MTWESSLITFVPYWFPPVILYLNIVARKTAGQKTEGSGADMFLTLVSLDLILLFENLGDEFRVGLSVCFLVIHLFLWLFSIYLLFRCSLELEIPSIGLVKFPEWMRTLVTQVLAVFSFGILMYQIVEGKI